MDMDDNTILVVMPVYNSEKTLKSAVDSVLNQSYTNIHLVIVDDCSTDNSLEIAMSYNTNKRVTLIRNKANMGAYYSRNMGLYKMRNQPWGYFTTHDADDVSKRGRLEMMQRHFRNKRTNAVQDTWQRVRLKSNKKLTVSLTCAHAMFTRDVFNNLGYFDLVRFGADWEHWARLNVFNSSRKLITRSISEVTGTAYIGENNLTEQIPAGAGPREMYIEDSREVHKLMAAGKKPIRIEFSPSSKPRDLLKKAKNSKKVAEQAMPQTSRYKNTKVTVVLLTWRRMGALKQTLAQLSNQTFENFDVYISNGNLSHKNNVESYAKLFKDKLNIRVGHEGNDLMAFRRFTVGKQLAQEGTDIVLFIDDDISFDHQYVETCLRYYEPKSYKSGFAWHFFDNGSDYYGKRKRVFDTKSVLHYCGTGISIIDAKIFLDNKLISQAPPEALAIEDLWLSYYVQHVKKWKLGYIPMSNVQIGGADGVALYKSIIKNKQEGTSTDKADFLRQLVKEYGWKLKRP